MKMQLSDTLVLVVLLLFMKFRKLFLKLVCLLLILPFGFVIITLNFMWLLKSLKTFDLKSLVQRMQKIENLLSIGSLCLTLILDLIMEKKNNWTYWLNAIISALVAFLTALGASSCVNL